MQCTNLAITNGIVLVTLFSFRKIPGDFFDHFIVFLWWSNDFNQGQVWKLSSPLKLIVFVFFFLLIHFLFRQKKAQTSVFSRLGGMASPPAPSQTTVQAVNPRLRLPSSEETLATIDYTSHSVLQPVKRKGVPAKPVKPVKPVKRSLGPTSSVDEKSVFARLGSKA